MNKKIITLLILVGLFMTALTASAQVAFDWPYKTVDGTIVTQVPERPAGQQPVLGLTAPKLKVVRVGFVGLGMRGPDAVRRFTHINGTQVMALCDHERERADTCNTILRAASMPPADIY